jgi:Lar family restriction alleviation protein
MKVEPCPFCGSIEVEVVVGTKDREGTPAHLACSECGAGGPWTYCANDPHTTDYSRILTLYNTRHKG